MKKILKKNQIMITALAIMIAVAGYLNFAGNKIGEEELVVATGSEVVDEVNANALDISAEDEEQAALQDIESLDSEVVLESTDYPEEELAAASVAAESTAVASAAVEQANAESVEGNNEIGVPGEAVFTTSNVGNLASAKLVKEQTRAKNKETLLEVINNVNIESSQKQDAINNMIALTDIAEKEMAAEILLEAKGFSDAVVSISDGSVDVVVSAGELTEAQRAQIEDIVKRKTGILAENIIITPI